MSTNFPGMLLLSYNINSILPNQTLPHFIKWSICQKHQIRERGKIKAFLMAVRIVVRIHYTAFNVFLRWWSATKITPFKVSHPKRRLYQNELIFCMIKLQVLCGIVPKIQEFLPSQFYLQGYEMMHFHNFVHLRKRCISLLEFENDENL